MARPRHSKKEIEAAIQYAEDLGWTVNFGGSHAWGHLYCPLHTREGCIVPIWSTPRNAGDFAKLIRRRVNRCRHGAEQEPEPAEE